MRQKRDIEEHRTNNDWDAMAAFICEPRIQPMLLFGA
jgi:hypothetical protein